MSILYVNAVAAFKKQFAYRIPVVVTLIGSIVSVYIQIALWSYLYKNDMRNIEYMISYIVISNFISCLYEPNLAKDIEARFRTGDLAIDLIRPANVSLVFWGQAIGIAAGKFVLRGMPVSIIFALLYRDSLALIKFGHIGSFLFVSVFSTIIHNSLFFSIGYLSIKTNAIWPYVRIVNDTIRFVSGSVIPLKLFPEMFRKLLHFLPFGMLYSFPIELLLGELAVRSMREGFLLLVLWALLFALLEKVMYNVLSKGIAIQGG